MFSRPRLVVFLALGASAAILLSVNFIQKDDIDEIVATDVHDFIDKTDDEDTFVYVGWDKCPWCSVYKPEFYDALEDLNVKSVTSFSPYDIKGLNDAGNDYRTKDYRVFIDYIDKASDGKAIELGYLDYYSEELKLKWFYAPKLYKFENGKIVGQIGVLDDHVMADNVVPGLSREQKKNLEEEIRSLL